MKEFFKKIIFSNINKKVKNEPLSEKFEIKEILKNLVISNINNWVDKDIYAISLFVYDENDNPCKPTVTLGYNTETHFNEELSNASNEQEARWNYAFWLQNEFLCFGIGETAKEVKVWLKNKQLPFYDDDDEAWDDDATYDKVEVIIKLFIDELVEVVKEIHQSGFLTQKFGKELPIIIHELEYYDEIAEQNIKANGRVLLEDFVDFCRG